jgi:hypothetical protein
VRIGPLWLLEIPWLIYKMPISGQRGSPGGHLAKMETGDFRQKTKKKPPTKIPRCHKTSHFQRDKGQERIFSLQVLPFNRDSVVEQGQAHYGERLWTSDDVRMRPPHQTDFKQATLSGTTRLSQMPRPLSCSPKHAISDDTCPCEESGPCRWVRRQRENSPKAALASLPRCRHSSECGSPQASAVVHHRC